MLRLPSRSLVLLALRCVMAVVALFHLWLGILALTLRPSGYGRGIALALALFTPVLAWLLSLRSLRLGAWSFLMCFLAVWLVNTFNDDPCTPGPCTLSGFAVSALPNLMFQTTQALLFGALAFYAMHRFADRSPAEQVSST